MKRGISLLLFLLVVFLSFGLPATAQTDNLTQVKKKLKTLTVQTVKVRCQHCKVDAAFKWISPKIKDVPASHITGLYFDAPGTPSGYVNASVDFENSPAVKATVQMYITIRKKVPVASTRIKQGAAIDAQKLEWRWKDITRLNRLPVSSLKYFENKTAVRIIGAGEMIFASDLVSRRSIQPGEHVVMLYKKEGVRIAIDCIARDTKDEGDKISLYSKETGQRYVAKIINQNKIVWVKTL